MVSIIEKKVNMEVLTLAFVILIDQCTSQQIMQVTFHLTGLDPDIDGLRELMCSTE